MKKKTVLVEHKPGKTWSIKVTSTSERLRLDLIELIHGFTEGEGFQIFNATDPFGDTISKRKRKIHKPVMGPAERTQAIDALQDLKHEVLKS